MLREFLTNSVVHDRQITVGDVVSHVSDMIPLHTASRKWAANHQGEDDPNYPPAHRMRQYVITQEMHWLKCAFDPPGRKTWDTHVIVAWRFCPVCGNVYVNFPKIRTCGAKCGAKLRATPSTARP